MTRLDTQETSRKINQWQKTVSFATQIDGAVLEEVRTSAKELGQSISKFVENALVEHLQRVRVRPVFTNAMNQVIDENAELPDRLAK